MSSSLLARGLLVSVALSILVAPAALADDPVTTDTTTTTETTTTTTTTESTGTTTGEATTTGGADAPPPDPWAETPETLQLLSQAVTDRAIARRWRALMGRPRPYLRWPDTAFGSLLERRAWLAQVWRAKAVRALWQAARPPHRGAWVCIHNHEGAWRDPNSPYYGGLQMDVTFQRQYGWRLFRSKGTADHWTPLEQMWVGEHALRAGRGFYPWPVSARSCGLI
jgi:hypothetical protein